MEQSNVLRVLTGLHRGASAPLPRPGLVVIGTAEDCDLVLMDEGIAPRHAAISLHEQETSIRALGGAITLNGQEIAPGRIAALSGEERIAMGPVTLALGAGEAPAIEARISLSRPEDAATAEVATPLRNARGRTAVTTLIGCVIAGALVLAMFVPFSGGESRDEPAEQRVAALLSQLKLEKEIRSTLSADGTITLTGTTRDEVSYAALVRELAEQHLAPVMHVTSRERIMADVRNVFRVNGMDVEAEYLQGGIVKVRGLTAEKSDADRVIQHALRDVRGLKEVRIDGAVSPAPAAVNVAAKRVVSIVDGSPAYVVTADGARYFVGATLPQGQRVVAIKGNAVTLERNGEQLVMNF